MRADRLLSLLLLVQNRGRLTARQLAGALEVSVRTIYRDARALQAAGVPLYAEAGPDGGYRLLAGYRTRLTGLTHREADALVLAGMPGPAAELGWNRPAATAALKVRAALPPELAARAEGAASRFHFDAAHWYTDGDASPHLGAVAEAVFTRRPIRVRYRRWKRPTEVERVLRPYGLVLKAGRWYLVAASDADPDGPRTYRVNQIVELTALDGRFAAPAGFDLATYWTARLREFHAGLHTGEATIRLSPDGWERLPSLFQREVVAAAGRSASAPDRDGWITATVPIESLAVAEADLLRLGADVEVLAPGPLRARLARTARTLAHRYAP